MNLLTHTSNAKRKDQLVKSNATTTISSGLGKPIFKKLKFTGGLPTSTGSMLLISLLELAAHVNSSQLHQNYLDTSCPLRQFS